jgi:glycosyltransferase involved in cell wall biosynthesis
MSSVPELTVVIPFYNRGDTVPLTLESVRRARQMR